jgi:hypothetical protein
MSDTDVERLEITRRVAAPAAKIFAVVSSPQGHVDIDGSGMLVAAPEAKPVQAVGDTFDMNMDREPLGDVPEMGKYTVRNFVTIFEPDREVAWTVGSEGRSPIGHVYGYRLEPVSADVTDVTTYIDWSNVKPRLKERISWPVVPAHMLESSLLKLDQLVSA